MLMVLAAFSGILIGAAPVPQMEGAAQGPLVQLAADLEGAMSRAHLTDAQKAQLQADDDILRSNIRLKASGADVDRSQVVKAVKDLRNLTRSGTFLPEDQRKLEADIQALRKR